MMSERKAWLLLAEAWNKPKRSQVSDNYCVSLVGGNYAFECCYGLCECIGDLLASGHITRSCGFKMESRIDKLGDERKVPGLCYVWPLTRYGARKRREFCLKQVDLLTRKRRPVCRKKKASRS